MKEDKQRNYIKLGCAITIGVIVFLSQGYLAYVSVGYAVDLNCFGAWGMRMAEVGPANFYAPDYFCDYPPGFIYILGMLGRIANGFGITLLDWEGQMLIKMFSIPFNVILAYLVYFFAKKEHLEKGALIVLAIMAFNPVYYIAGPCWGQVDAFLSVLVVLILWCAYAEKWDIAIPLFAFAVLQKPQAGLLAPLAISAFIMECFVKKEKKQAVCKMLCGIGYALIVVAVIVIPFSKNQSFPGWLIDKYVETLSSYNYATLSTGNLMFLLGGNWVETSEPIIGAISYGTVGTILMILSFLFGIIVYVKSKKKSAILLAGAVTFQALFVLSTKIHERYIIPALALLIMVYVIEGDRKLLLSYVICSIASAWNIGIVLIFDYLYDSNTWMGYIISICQIIALVLTIMACVQMMKTEKIKGLEGKEVA